MRFIKYTLGIVTLILLCAIQARGQNGNYTNIVFGPSGRPISNPSITVCLLTDATCTAGDVSLYSDPAALHPITNPFNGDGYGNYSFWTTAGSYKVTISGNGISTSTTMVAVPCLPTSTGCGGGGGGIAPPGLALQLANPGATGPATACLSSNCLSVDNATSPTVLNVPFSASVGGPRPTMDVTSTIFAGGAKGDSQTDDTAAIQAAINAACATKTALNNFPMVPAVTLPPGIYRAAQPQSGSSPVFTIPCSFLEIRGFPGGSSDQFANPTSWIDVIAGATPNAAPMFYIPPGVHNVRFKDIKVTGYNEAYWVRSAADITFDNAPMAATGQTGLADNTPLKITNTEELWRINRSNASAVQSGGAIDPTTPTVIYTNEASRAGESPVDGYIYTLDDVDTGGGEQCIQRVSPGNVFVQNFVFERDFIEDTNTGFFGCINTSGSPMTIGPMTFETVGTEAFSLFTSAVVNLNDPQGTMYGITMDHVNGGAAAIQILAGHLFDYHVTGCNTICSNQVVDGSGDSIGTGTTTDRFGAVNHSSDTSYEVAFPVAGLSKQTNAAPAISDRWCASGVQFCSLGADPSFGFLFGKGDSNSFNAGLQQTSIESLDVQVASLLPPTSFTGTATTGGTLTAGTYFAQIWSASNSNCFTAPVSAPTYGSGTVVGGSNNAINFAWTVPITTPSTPVGYCIEIQTSAISPGSQIFNYLFTSGSGTTTFAYTGQSQNSTTLSPANVMGSVHRFGQNYLHVTGGVNNYTDTGIAGNTYVITTAPTFTTIPLGFQTCFYTVNASTGASTLNPNGIGPVSIKTPSGAALTTNIPANSWACVIYDVSGNFELQGTSSGGGTPCITTALSLQFNSSGSFGCVPDLVFTAPHTITLGASGIFVVTGSIGGAGTLTGAMFTSQVNGSGVSAAGMPNFVTSTTNAGGITLTPSNPTGANVKFEATIGSTLTVTNLTIGGTCTGCPTSGTTFQTNTVNNSSQTTLNLLNSAATDGITLTATNTSAGNVQLGFTGTATNAFLANAATTVNGQTCTLGSTCTIPFQTNGVSNSSQAGTSYTTSTANAVGLTVTPVNSSGIIEKFEVTGSSYTGNAATATALAATPSLCSTGQAPTGILANGNATGCSAGSGTVNPATQFSHAYYSAAGTASTISGVAAPSTNGLYSVFYNVTASAAVAPTLNLVGVPIDATNPATLLYSDRASYLNWTSGTALALPAVAGNFAANMPFVLKNTSTTLTVTPNAGASDLIDGASSGTIIPNFAAFVYQDSTTAPGHWFTVKFPTFAAFGSSCGSSTQALSWSTTAGFGCQTISGSAAAGGSNTQLQYNNAGALGGMSQWTTNGTTTVTAGSTAILDLSACPPTTCLKVPSVAGAIPVTSAFFGYNITNNSFVGGSNGTTLGFAVANTGTGASTTCGSHTWFNFISTNAVPTCTQPAASDLSVAALANGITATTQSQNDNSTKLATTAYTDLAVSNGIAGVNPAVAVLAATTVNLTGTYTQVGGGIGDTFTVTATGAFTLDGIAINTIGQRVLLKNQGTASQNGVYTATIVGTTGISPVFTRALDYDTPSDVNNTGIVPVQSGTVNIDTSWLLTSQVTSIGSSGSSLTYTQFSTNPANIVLAVSPGAGLCHFAGSTQTCTSSAVSLTADVSGTLPAGNGGTGVTSLGTNQATAFGISDTTFTNATTSVGANACSASAVTVTMTGVTTSMTFSITPSSDTSGSTGWGSTGGLVIDAWPTSNTLNYKLCNQTASPITPGAITWNVSAR